ncbi:unnamed protein product [Mortierella alpina]
MLLLVPAQKSEGNRSDDKQNPFSIRSAHSSHNSSSSFSSPSTCGRVLVVLPPRTDMSSTLVVSDKSITTALTTTLCSSQHPPCGELNHVTDPATRTYWSRHENTEEANDAVAEKSRPYGSRPPSGNHARPSRRHSYFRSSVAEHSHAWRWSTHPRSRSRSNKTASLLRQKSCISSTTTSSSSSSSSTSTTSTTSTATTNTTSRPLSPHPPYSDSQRLLREAFKKTMTVRSPLLTSTSSGMVLDLTPGPALESRWKEVETGKWSSSTLDASAAAERSIEGERRRIQVSAKSKALSQPESSSSESIQSDRGTSMNMSDAEDRSLDKNDEEEEEEEQDDDDESNNSSNKNPGMHIKMGALEDDQSLHSIAIGSSGRTSSRATGKGASTDLQADLVLEPTTQHKAEALSRSGVMNARSKSTSSVTSPFSSPVLPRMPTRPPSAPLPALSGQEAVMTAQDIALRTASLGALTPFEIQRRMYEHAHSKLSSSRWPIRRRKSAGVILEGRSQGDALLSSSSLQTQPTPLPLRKSFPPALPSYYYLPPSAFRTAAAAAAEEQQEAEHRRKKEQEQKEKEENSFFEFPSPSPSPSPPPQASPSC